MKKLYILGIILSAFILIANQIFIQYWLSTKKSDAQQINIAGRQRMLSQKINLEFYQIFYESKSNMSLKKLFQEWQNSHNILLLGDKKNKILAINDYQIRKNLIKLQDKIVFTQQYVYNHKNLKKASFQKITQNQNDFLEEMNQAVKDLEIIADQKLNFIIFIEIVLTIFALLLISLEVFLIYMPMSSRLKSINAILKQDNYKLEALENSRSSAIAYIDTDLKLRYTNILFREIHETIFGKKPQIGDVALDFVESKHLEETEDIYRRVLAGEVVEYVRNHQKRYWFFELFPIYNKEKEIEGISHSFKEITERIALQKDKNHLERRVNIIAENFPEGSITLLNKNLSILYTNGEEYRKAGIDPKRYTGRSVHKFLAKKQLHTLLENIEKIQQGGTVSYEVEYLSKHYLVKLKPIFEHNELINIVIISSNITSLVKRQQEIIAKKKRLEAYANYNSHILRAPIARLLGLSSILLELKLSKEEFEKFLIYINQSSKLLDEVSRHMQDILYAKDEATYQKLISRKFDFNNS